MALHAHVSNVLAFVFSGLSTLVVALRFYSRLFLIGKLTSSCWVMMFALIFIWGSVVVNWYMLHYLDHSHIYDKDSFAKLATGSLLTFWIYRVSFILDLCLVKTSILLFYSDIAASNRCFRHLSRTLMVIVLLGSISMIFAGVFTCFPVAEAWSFKVFEGGLSGIHASECYRPRPFWLFNAGYNLVTDIAIWSLPILLLPNIRSMSTKHHAELIAVFSVGLVAVIASASRLNAIVLWLDEFENHTDITPDLSLWSQVEQNAGLWAASLPFLRPIFYRSLADTREEQQQNSDLVTFTGTRDALSDPEMIRTPIIPSPSPTIASEKEFRIPQEHLVPIQLTRGDGAAIWDGS